jgi:hypothetical protein
MFFPILEFGNTASIHHRKPKHSAFCNQRTTVRPCFKQRCQMVCFQTKNHNLGKLYRALDWKMFMYLMAIWNTYFMEIWDILWPFGTFFIHFVFFSGFGIMYQEKSGNPGFKHRNRRSYARRSLFQLISTLFYVVKRGFVEPCKNVPR